MGDVEAEVRKIVEGRAKRDRYERALRLIDETTHPSPCSVADANGRIFATNLTGHDAECVARDIATRDGKPMWIIRRNGIRRVDPA